MPEIVKEYQPKDAEGRPIGPIQRFIANTPEEMIEKLAIAHQNASAKLYETKKAVKIGSLVEPDPADPIVAFEPRSLTADELVQIAEESKKPETVTTAYQKVFEAAFGAPVETIRSTLRYADARKRADRTQAEVNAFLKANPHYYQTQENHDSIMKWLEKRSLPVTKKNLELAVEDLGDVLVTPPPPAPLPEAPPSPSNPAPPAAAAPSKSPAAPDAGAAPEPPAEPAIPVPVVVAKTPAEIQAMSAAEYLAWIKGAGTELPPGAANSAPATASAPANTERTVDGRPVGKGSSGLSGRGTSAGAPPPTPPKPGGVTARMIASWSAQEYAKNLADPVLGPQIRALVDKQA